MNILDTGKYAIMAKSTHRPVVISFGLKFLDQTLTGW